MYCPVCNYNDTKVVDSRITNEGSLVRRRRECPKCTFRFSTYEQIELLNIAIVKRDGKREAYSREKMELGLKRALQKRPYTQEAFQNLITQIERSIQKLKKREITSEMVGELVMKHLKRFDKVAYIRFASVYQSFDDLKTFQHELSELTKTKKPKKKK